MTSSLFAHDPEQPKNRQANNAYLILCSTRKSASSFLDIYDNTQLAERPAPRSTDEEQDLLRAMLVFASAGLDSMTKQLVSDALPSVIERDEGAGLLFKQFIERRLTRSEKRDNRFLANVLGDFNPRLVLINELVSDITSRSLQSVDQILKTAAYFNIDSRQVCENPRALQHPSHEK